MTRNELIAEAGNRSGIYVAECIEGKRKGWRYVGQAGNLTARLQDYGYSRRRTFFENALRKYTFDWSVVYCCPVDRLDKMEIFYISYWNTNKSKGGRGFNLTDGGGGRRGHKVSDATRAKISAANKGRKHTAESKAKMRGRKRTAEHRAKNSAANKGRKHTAEARARMSATLKGRKHTAEHRAKLSATLKGHKVSAETRAKIGKAFRGKKLSAEHRAKIGEAGKGHKRNVGYKHTAEARAKMSVASKKHKLSPEHLAKLQAGRRALDARRKACCSLRPAGVGENREP